MGVADIPVSISINCGTECSNHVSTGDFNFVLIIREQKRMERGVINCMYVLHGVVAVKMINR